MPHQPEIWTSDVRRVLYRRLVQLFGTAAEWEQAGSPGGEHTASFNEFCDHFAKVVGASSGDAVKHQIRFAMPESGRGSTWRRQAQTAILNKAAALEAGFITDGQLPDLLAVGRAATRAAS